MWLKEFKKTPLYQISFQSVSTVHGLTTNYECSPRCFRWFYVDLMCPSLKCLLQSELMLKWIPGSFPTLFCSLLCYHWSIVYDRGTAGTVCHTDPLIPPLSLCLKQQLKLLSHRLLYFFPLRAIFLSLQRV